MVLHTAVRSSHLFLVFALASSLTVCFSAVGPAYSEGEGKNSTSAVLHDSNCVPANHPVLLNCEKFQVNVVLAKDSNQPRLSSDLFEKDKRLAQEFSLSCFGKLSDEIAGQFGEPYSKGASYISATNPGETEWMYFIGHSPAIVRLSIKGGRCVSASSRIYFLDDRYADWILSKITKECTGASRARIAELLGQPVQIDEDPQRLHYNLGTLRLSFKFGKDQCESIEIVHKYILRGFELRVLPQVAFWIP